MQSAEARMRNSTSTQNSLWHAFRACGSGDCEKKSKIPFNANDDKPAEKDARKTLIEELEKAIRRGAANVNDAQRQLTRTSEDCGCWRVDVSGTTGEMPVFTRHYD